MKKNKIKNEIETEENLKLTSFSLEIADILNRIIYFWKLVNWPYHIGYEIYLNELNDKVFNSIASYAILAYENHKISTEASPLDDLVKLIETLNNNNETNSNHNNNNNNNNKLKLNRFQKLIVTANDLEHVRESLNLFIKQVNFSSKKCENQLSLTEEKLQDTNKMLNQTIDKLLQTLIDHKVN